MDDESSHFPEDLAELNAAIDTITITSADAERGFSTMNLICTCIAQPTGRRTTVKPHIRQPSWTIDRLFQRPTVCQNRLTRGHRAACDNQSRNSEPHKQECRYYHIRKLFD